MTIRPATVLDIEELSRLLEMVDEVAMPGGPKIWPMLREAHQR